MDSYRKIITMNYVQIICVCRGALWLRGKATDFSAEGPMIESRLGKFFSGIEKLLCLPSSKWVPVLFRIGKVKQRRRGDRHRRHYAGLLKSDFSTWSLPYDLQGHGTTFTFTFTK